MTSEYTKKQIADSLRRFQGKLENVGNPTPLPEDHPIVQAIRFLEKDEDTSASSAAESMTQGFHWELKVGNLTFHTKYSESNLRLKELIAALEYFGISYTLRYWNIDSKGESKP